MSLVLVALASRHGSTREIGKAIASQLQASGLDAVVAEPTEIITMDGFDAAIIRSAVYAGHWMKDARDLVELEAEGLRHRPTWLFSVGPLGDAPASVEDPVDLPRLIQLVNPRKHRIFAGSLDRDRLGFFERAIVRLVHAPTGDFRPWPAIADWAQGIANELKGTLVA